jgi:hypothetical protein
MTASPGNVLIGNLTLGSIATTTTGTTFDGTAVIGAAVIVVDVIADTTSAGTCSVQVNSSADAGATWVAVGSPVTAVGKRGVVSLPASPGHVGTTVKGQSNAAAASASGRLWQLVATLSDVGPFTVNCSFVGVDVHDSTQAVMA